MTPFLILMLAVDPIPAISDPIAPGTFRVCFNDTAYACEYTGSFERAMQAATKLLPDKLHCVTFPNGEMVWADSDHHCYVAMEVLRTFDLPGPDTFRHRPMGSEGPWTDGYAAPETSAAEAPAPVSMARRNEAYGRGFRVGCGRYASEAQGFEKAYAPGGACADYADNYQIGIQDGKTWLGKRFEAIRAELSKAVAEPSKDVLALARQVTNEVCDQRNKQAALAVELADVQTSRAYNRGVADGALDKHTFSDFYAEGAQGHEDYGVGLAYGSEVRTQQRAALAHDVEVLRGELNRTQNERDYLRGYVDGAAHRTELVSATKSWREEYPDVCNLRSPVFRKA